MPVVFLTARRRHPTTASRGLTIGADDYVAKPFSLEELVARVRAVLRRPAATRAARCSGHEDLALDEESREVRRAGALVEPHARPSSACCATCCSNARPGRSSKARSWTTCWHYDFGGDSNVVETYISYLRKKVDPPASR